MRRYYFALCFFIGQSIFAGPDTRKFSEMAWSKIAPIYQAIRVHPFNQKLEDGTLSHERFLFYSTQDSMYLTAFGKALAILATRLDERQDIKNVFNEAISSWNEEKQEQDKTAKQGVAMAPATRLYTDFLLTTAAYKSREELVASLLPCFWIYSRLATELKSRVRRNNPYFDWVSLYSSGKYKKSVDRMIALADDLASKVSSEQRAKMIEAFVLASRMEWYFWEASYNMEHWKPE